MSWSPGPPRDPAGAPPQPGRPWFRRWWVIGGLVVVLLLVGGAAVYAGTQLAGNRDSGGGEQAGPTAEPTSPFRPSPVVPTGLPNPSDLPEDKGATFCFEILEILGEVTVAEDRVAARREALEKLQRLDAPTPSHQEAFDEYLDEYEAAVQMVEDDPNAEPEARGREKVAFDQFVDSGGCRPG